MKAAKIFTILVLGLIVSLAMVGKAAPMGTAFTYQGRLMDANNPADGLYDFEFKLFDDPCTGTSVTLQGVNASSENGSGSNCGLYNYQSKMVTLRGGAFNARGGSNIACGIYNAGNEMIAESVTALAESGSSNNYGLYNDNDANATLIGGSFTARGGTTTYGIYNSNNNSTLEANNINALAENGSSNYGLYNNDGISDVTQSVLESQNFSVYNVSGTLTISNSRLVGGPCGGSVTCVAVSRGSTISTDGSTCP